MITENIRIGILCLYLLKEAFEYLVQYLNLRHMRKAGAKLPPEFKGKVDQDMLKKMQDYEVDKIRFNFVSSMFGNIITIAFIFGGLLNIYNSWIASLRLPFLISGWLFFILLVLASEGLEIPFSLYSTFKIENKYGFNTMTLRLWFTDFLKSTIISFILLSLVLLVGLYLLQLSPHFWWFWVWLFLLVFGIFIMYISPYVIEPLFNKFTPVEDESLKERIAELNERAGIQTNKILRVDASKRSKHTNAYFTGLGKTKRIVLFDTLLNSMSHEEIIAVLAHEIGHWKKRHLLKTLVLFEFFSLSALYAAFKFIQGDFLTRLFNISTDTIYAKFVILAFFGSIISLPVQIFFNYLSRKYEREADRISYELTKDSQNIVSTLIKLSRENLSNLYPHPLYVTIYYSHPPVIERIRYINLK